MNIRDLFFRPAPAPEPSVCVFSEKAELVEYTTKDDRSNPVVYQTEGRAKYGSGIPPSNYDTAVDAFSKFPLVYSAISARAEAVAGLNIKIFDVRGDLEEEVDDDPFYQVFRSPNPGKDSFEFLEQVSQSLDVTGNAFIAIEKASKGTKQPFEMYLLPTPNVAIIPDSRVKVKEYRFYSQGQFVKYKPEEIIHIRYNNFNDSYFGAPPLTSATDILNFEDYRVTFSSMFFQNGAVPLGVLESEATMSDTILRKLRGDWNAIHGGLGNSNKIAILQGGLKYKPIASPLKDLDLSNLRRLSKEDILSIFKIPESVLGDLSNTSGSEGQDALRAFWRQSLVPQLRRIEAAMNRGLKDIAFKGGTRRFKFNLNDVEALSDDKEKTAGYIRILIESSVITPNQGAAMLGLPQHDDPLADNLFISNSTWGNALIPASQAPTGPNPNGVNAQAPTARPAQAPAPKAPTAPAKPVAKPKN